MGLQFGTDGIRGVANADLTPALALALGRAAARRLGASAFLVGRDTRLSGPMLQAAFSAGVASEGVDVVDLGVIPTPGVAFLASARRLPAAMISASHNPFEDNGIKLLSPDGSKLPAEVEAAIEGELATLHGAASPVAGDGLAGLAAPAALRALQTTAPAPQAPARTVPTGDRLGRFVSDERGLAEYAGHLLATIPPAALSGLHVVLDCGHGAASEIAPRVFAQAGARVTAVETEPDGTNINRLCGSTHPEHLAATVVGCGADLGLAFDGDADRTLAADHDGRIVDGDELIALFATDLLARGELPGAAVVVTVMSNLGLRQALAASGIAVVETPVGDRFVSDALESNGLALGGEQSGHIVFRRHATTGDGVLTGLLLVELVARSGRPLASLAGEAMQRVPQFLENVPVRDPSSLAGAETVWETVRLLQDRLGSSGRVVLRASGTEARVRVMVEATSEQTAREAVEHLAGVVRRELAGPALATG